MDQQKTDLNTQACQCGGQGCVNIWAIIATAVITAIIAGGITYYWQNTTLEAEKQSLQEQVNQLQMQVSLLEERDVEQQVVEDQYKDWKMYRNEEYGFELTLNDAWEGYKVFKKEFPGEQVTRFDFEIMGSNQSWLPVFSVSIMSLSEWKKNPGEISPLASSDKYVYWIFYPTDVYDDTNLNKSISSAQSVGSTFRLIVE